MPQTQRLTLVTSHRLTSQFQLLTQQSWLTNRLSLSDIMGKDRPVFDANSEDRCRAFKFFLANFWRLLHHGELRESC